MGPRQEFFSCRLDVSCADLVERGYPTASHLSDDTMRDFAIKMGSNGGIMEAWWAALHATCSDFGIPRKGDDNDR